MKIKKTLKTIIISSAALLTFASFNTSNINSIHARHIRTHKIYKHHAKPRRNRIRSHKASHRRITKIKRIKARNKRIHARNLRIQNRRHHKKAIKHNKQHRRPLMLIAKPNSTVDQSKAIKKYLAKDLSNYRYMLSANYEIDDDCAINENDTMDSLAQKRANQIADHDYSVYDDNNEDMGYAEESPNCPNNWAENIDTTYHNNPGTNDPKKIAQYVQNQFENTSTPTEGGGNLNADGDTKDNMRYTGNESGFGVTYRPGRGYYIVEDYGED